MNWLQLYTEEITDLLSMEEEPTGPSKEARKGLPLMDDRKGGVVVKGLEEALVKDAAEVRERTKPQSLLLSDALPVLPLAERFAAEFLCRAQIFTLLERGTAKRKTAETLLNKQVRTP